ncbi:MAG: PQQ-like beta-propeller repeat protein, partial [bacterium]|nr:PQQ-like beta-propeller repeat protein [bacterium]
MISKRLSVLALAAICVASLGETPRDATWTMARANAELNPVVESLVPDLSWRTPLTDGTNATPVVANGRVFIDGNGHVLWTLDLYTGSVLWQQLAGNELSGVPLLYNGVVIISQGQPSGRGANGIVGIDATTGKRLWYASLDGSGTPTPAIVDGQLVNHDSTGELEVFDPTTGTERWHKNLGTHAHASAITPISPTAFVTAGDDPDDVVAMDVRSRKILWRAPLPADARSAGSTYLAYDGTRIFGMYFAPRAATEKAPYHATQRLYALDAKTGHTLWSADVASGVAQERFLSSIPLVHDDTVYAGSPL